MKHQTPNSSIENKLGKFSGYESQCGQLKVCFEDLMKCLKPLNEFGFDCSKDDFLQSNLMKFPKHNEKFLLVRNLASHYNSDQVT